MKTAFAHWDNRIAPVFDTALKIRLVEADSGRIVSEKEEVLADDLPAGKVGRLAELGAGALVCGAISKPAHEMAVAHGIRVFSFVAGNLSEVIRAWLAGALERNTFAMPGCYRRGRHRCGGLRRMDQEEYPMNGKGRAMGSGGGGRGGGRGQGRSGRGRGRMGGPLAGGAGGTCVCPKCGHREPHERGIPCMQKQCPECGTAMTRE
jgi:predicted Fe-Mo cluster-binding NifX family protein